MAICEEVIEKYFNEKALFWEIENTRDRIKKFVSEDTYYSLTYGFSYDDFLDSYTEEVVRHCPYGIMPYVTRRVESAMEQIPTISTVYTKSQEFPITYLGEGVFLLGKNQKKESLDAYNINGIGLRITWLSHNLFHIDPEQKVLILIIEDAYKKVLMQ